MRTGRVMAVPRNLWWALLALVVIAGTGVLVCGATLVYLCSVLDRQDVTIRQNRDLIRQLERMAAEPAGMGASVPAGARS